MTGSIRAELLHEIGRLSRMRERIIHSSLASAHKFALRTAGEILEFAANNEGELTSAQVEELLEDAQELEQFAKFRLAKWSDRE